MSAEVTSPKLGRLQRWMLAVITHPGGIAAGADTEEARRWCDAGSAQLEDVVTRSQMLSARDRLAVYGNAYFARLLECLGEVYPVLRRTLGEEVFLGFARDYLLAHPSRSYTLNELGRKFPAFLAHTRPGPGESDAGDWADFLIDLARLEWAIYEVFDGPGMEEEPPLEILDLDLEPIEEWMALRFCPDPSLRLLEFRYPVNDHYTAVRASEGELTTAFPPPGRYFLAVTRRNYIVRRYVLDEAQYLLLSNLVDGEDLGTALEELWFTCGDAPGGVPLVDCLSCWFEEWAADGGFFAAILPPPKDPDPSFTFRRTF